jgi:cysteine synthase
MVMLLTLSAIIMPDDVAEEKVKALLALGADVERVRPASIVDKKQVISDQTSFFNSLLNCCLTSMW